MDDFPGLLARDFGYKPQGKSAPMAPPRTTTTATSSSSSSSYGLGSGARASNSYNSAKSAPIFDDHDRGGDDLLFSDVFSGGGPPKYSDQPPLPRTGSAAASPSFDYDTLFKEQNAKSSSLPVFDKPVYDEDIFDGLPGIKSASPSAAAASPASSKFHEGGSRSSAFDDLFADLVKEEAGEQVKRPAEKDASPAFDDLLQGFGRSSSPGVSRSTSESKRPQKPSSDLSRTASDVMDDPFASLNSTSKTPTSSSGLFTDPLEEISKFSSSGSAKVDTLYGRKGVLDDLDPLENLGRPIPPVSTEIKKGGKDRSPLHSTSFGDTYSPASNETYDHCPVASAEGHSQRKVLVDDFPGPSEPIFDIPATSESHRSAGRAASSPSLGDAGANDTNFVLGSENASEAYDDIWLTVSEVPLFTQPTTAPPPSRPPPPRPPRINKPRTSAFSSPNSRRKVHENSSLSNSQSPVSARAERTFVMDELDDFATGRPRAASDEHADVFCEDVDTSSAAASAAAMKEAMDKAEAKFRQMREREYLKAARSKEAGVVDQDIQDMQQRESRERQERMDHEQQLREEEEREKRRLEKEREREEKEREQRRLERERERAREAERVRENGRHAVERATREARERAAIEARARAERAAADKDGQERMDHEQQLREEEEREKRRLEKEREREEKEREQRRLERERERAREAERVRENGRHAVERATREARERAAIEARARAERAAADKVAAEARQRAERVAVQRAQAEARERAAANARERAEKLAAEARERANAEAREKEAAEKSAALKAEADARTRAERAAVERAAAEARQRAAAAARANQQRNESSQTNENDLESFFSSRASSAPRPRATTSDPFFDTQSKGGPETPGRTSVGSTTNMRKASSATNIVDDLSSIFGAAAASGEFQEVEGETEDRRRARMERQHRTQERAAKALAEKNQRDLQVQREQAERDRIGETLDFEIKRWAAGKEGNMRALLSTMQYVLWPECGWQPVSLTDLITGASVKKAYRKATLCIHPDKVQQKGATLQQKYIAEKVFDLLKEAWNKFNSEELY